LLIVALSAGVWAIGSALASSNAERSRPPAAEAPNLAGMEAAAAAASDPLVLSYAAKFVCMEPLQAGQIFLGPVAPLVKEATGVLIHNPNNYPVTLYHKAVRAPLTSSPPATPGSYKAHTLAPDGAARLDCDEITRLLTGNPTATFLGTFGIGVEVEGFVVVLVGPQAVPGSNIIRYSSLDVVAEYVRASEVMKKDINYQTWWWHWWWSLPWRLGYAYERFLNLGAAPGNIDCRGLLYDELHTDANTIQDPQQQAATHAALEAGRNIDPTNVRGLGPSSPPALVALIGRCDKLDRTTAHVDYLLVSNKGATDPNPITGVPPISIAQPYPWIPGRWYDLALVVPQNRSIDLDDLFHNWQGQRWVDAGANAAAVQSAMVYHFPYWCGWGRWWWWWNAGDCVDIGVGEGESLDVEQITPVRVFFAQWPPTP
jgi:hypothetical protein